MSYLCESGPYAEGFTPQSEEQDPDFFYPVEDMYDSWDFESNANRTLRKFERALRTARVAISLAPFQAATKRHKQLLTRRVVSSELGVSEAFLVVQRGLLPPRLRAMMEVPNGTTPRAEFTSLYLDALCAVQIHRMVSPSGCRDAFTTALSWR